MAAELEDTPARRAYLALVQAHEKLAGEFADLFREHGLTQVQFNVLRILVQSPSEGCSCQHIGAQLINREPDVTRLLDRMETAGLVTRERSTDDRRVVHVRITPKGRKVCEGLYPAVAALHEKQFAGLSKIRTKELAAGLRELFEPTT